MTQPNHAYPSWADVDQDEMAEALMESYRADETDPVQLARAEVGFALAKAHDRQRRECTCRCHQGWRQRITAHGYRSCPCESWPA